ncbi:MAG: flagellar filament capping protein FliD [Campylobacterales bacterium]
MATGAISSLGIGSGVLTGDVIDQLKEADKKNMIDPYDEKIKTSQEKQAALAVLKSSLSSMDGLADTLSQSTTYLNRSSSVVGDEVSASVGSGFVPQDIKVVVDQLAQQDLYQSGNGFASRDSSFSTSNTALTFSTAGENFRVDIKANQTLEEVAQAITDATGGKVAATIMKTGGTNPYQLTLTGSDSGKENKVYFGSALQANTSPSGSLELGAGDFSFSFKDASGVTQSVDVTLPATDSESSKYDNAEALKSAVWNAVNDAGYGDLLYDESNPDATRGNPLKIDYDNNSGGLILNDTRGYEIGVAGNKVGELGFTMDTTASKESIVTSDSVNAGLIEGTFQLGGTTIDLSAVTSSGNTKAQNAQAIVDHINNNIGSPYIAELDGQDGFAINRDDGGTSISITRNGIDGTAEAKESTAGLEAIGLNAGTYKSEANLLNNTMDLQNLQSAQDAEFTYNGVQVNRSTNTVDDLVSGLTLTLNGTHRSGDSSTVKVTEDKSGIADDVIAFVEEYNNFTKQLAEDTDYDEELGSSGVFQGVSEVYSIRSSLNNILTFRDNDGNSLMEFGIYLNEDGTLNVDEDKLNSKVNSDFEGTENFFKGYTGSVAGRETEFDGVFTQFRDKLGEIATDPDSRLKNYDEYLTREMKAYNERKKDALELLQSRYDTMTMRFAAYDNMINTLNGKFSALQSMIQEQNSGK